MINLNKIRKFPKQAEAEANLGSSDLTDSLHISESRC